MLPIFFLSWIIFNGTVTLEILLFGIAISGAMFAFVCHFMEHSIQKELILYRKIPLLFRYFLLLLREILLANLTVFRLILTRREVVEPVLVHIRTDLRYESSRVILANSITLTPGTITVSMTGSDFLVHCLDQSLADGMENSCFVSLLRKMEEVEDSSWK